MNTVRIGSTRYALRKSDLYSFRKSFVVVSVAQQQQSTAPTINKKIQSQDKPLNSIKAHPINTSEKTIQSNFVNSFLDSNQKFNLSASQIALIAAFILSPITGYAFNKYLPEEQSQFLLQSILVTLGASSFGYIPYLSKVQGEGLEWMSSIGAGLLVSMALTMIIPSGAEQYVFNEMAMRQQHMVHMGMGETIQDCYHTNIMPIGNTILAGFGSLFLLDIFQQLSQKQRQNTNEQYQQNSQMEQMQQLNGEGQNLQFSENVSIALNVDNELQSQSQCMHTSNGPQQAISGLVIHSMADGLAMGTSALSGNLQLGFMVGLAMILHRGPMAFGLAAYLRQQNYPESEGLKGVWAFALACPITALTVYYVLGGALDGGDLMGPRNIALAMLFSGGSFLYAAFVHILPSVMKNAGKVSTTFTFVGGMLLPILMMSSMGHHHHHH